MTLILKLEHSEMTFSSFLLYKNIKIRFNDKT